jgi:uncharacterized protein YbjT (DUF2867 family)
MRVLVLGAAGKTGSLVVERALPKGHQLAVDANLGRAVTVVNSWKWIRQEAEPSAFLLQDNVDHRLVFAQQYAIGARTN